MKAKKKPACKLPLCRVFPAERQKENSEVVPNEESSLFRFENKSLWKHQDDRSRVRHRERPHHRLQRQERQGVHPHIRRLRQELPRRSEPPR